jgi:hypothetical protein
MLDVRHICGRPKMAAVCVIYLIFLKTEMICVTGWLFNRLTILFRIVAEVTLATFVMYLLHESTVSHSLFTVYSNLSSYFVLGRIQWHIGSLLGKQQYNSNGSTNRGFPWQQRKRHLPRGLAYIYI